MIEEENMDQKASEAFEKILNTSRSKFEAPTKKFSKGKICINASKDVVFSSFSSPCRETSDFYRFSGLARVDHKQPFLVLDSQTRIFYDGPGIVFYLELQILMNEKVSWIYVQESYLDRIAVIE